MPTNFLRGASSFLAGVAAVASLTGCGNSGNGSAGDSIPGVARTSVAGEVGSKANPASREKTPDRSSPAADVAPLSNEKVKELVDKLRRVWMPEEANPVVELLAGQGETAVAEIERRLTELGTDFGWVHRSVSVLEKVNSEASRSLLKQIALGDVTVDNPTLRAWAARALIACDANAARALLSSHDARVLEPAILGLRGHGLEPELLTALVTHTRSDDPITRFQAASILAQEAPPGELSFQALSAIKEALIAVATIPGLDGTELSSGPGSWQMTPAETHYQRYLSVLCESKAENPALREIAGELKGTARDVVLLALALRKDNSVHRDVLRILADRDAGLFRMWAASGLEQIGTATDLPTLREVATSDPLQRRGGCIQPNTPGFPVRESAKQAVTTIERRPGR